MSQEVKAAIARREDAKRPPEVKKPRRKKPSVPKDVA